MANCIIHNDNFKDLVERSGLTSLKLEALMNIWMTENNTEVWPTLEQLGIKLLNSTSNNGQIDYDMEVKNINDEMNFELNNLKTPSFKLTFISSKAMVDSDNPVSVKIKQDKIKEKYKELLSLIKCIG